MNRWGLVAAAATVGLGTGLYHGRTRDDGISVSSGSHSAHEEGAVGDASAAAAAGPPVDRSVAPPRGRLRAPRPAPKGEPVFGDEPLRAPQPPILTPGAAQRAEQAAQARALRPRLERQLERMRAKLASASPDERRRLQIGIEALERNLDRRQQREARVPISARQAPRRPATLP